MNVKDVKRKLQNVKLEAKSNGVLHHCQQIQLITIVIKVIV